MSGGRITVASGAVRQDEPLLSRRGGAWGAAWAGLVVVVLGVLVVSEWQPLLDVDRSIDAAVQRWVPTAPWAVEVSLRLADMGGFVISTYAAVAVVAILLVARRWWAALTLGCLAAFAPLLTHLIKPVVDRTRPAWPVPLANELTASFPSGHATAGIAVWAACGVALGSLVRNPSWGALVAFPFIVLGVAMGLARLVLGVHWSTDVLAGWCVALFVAGIVGALFVLPPYRPSAVLR